MRGRHRSGDNAACGSEKISASGRERIGGIRHVAPQVIRNAARIEHYTHGENNAKTGAEDYVMRDEKNYALKTEAALLGRLQLRGLNSSIRRPEVAITMRTLMAFSNESSSRTIA